MWLYRRVLKIPWTAKRSNESILTELGKGLTLANKIRSHQASFFGQVMRRHDLEHLITTAKVIGKRSRGRPREKILDCMKRWTGVNKAVDLIIMSEDRDLWRDMVPTPIGKEPEDDDEYDVTDINLVRFDLRKN